MIYYFGGALSNGAWDSGSIPAREVEKIFFARCVCVRYICLKHQRDIVANGVLYHSFSLVPLWGLALSTTVAIFVPALILTTFTKFIAV